MRQTKTDKKTATNQLLNVVLFPSSPISENSSNVIAGEANCLYLNSKYVLMYSSKDKDNDYTITWDAFRSIVGGLKVALPELEYKNILLNEGKLKEMFGEEWEKYLDDGSLMIRVEQYLELTP